MASLTATNLFSVKGMVFVITGGGSGLGEMMALALDANGASKVFILGRRQQSLDRVVSRALHSSIIPIICDTTSKASLAAAATAIEKHTPFVNAVVANAGVVGPITGIPERHQDVTVAELQKDLWNVSVEDVKSMLETNLVGSFMTFLAFLNLLDAGNKHSDSTGKAGLVQSQFITVTSYSAFARIEGPSHLYGASKTALTHLTQTLSSQFAKYGIRANSISPGLYITEMTEFVANGVDLSIPGTMPKEFIPATRTGNAEDVAGAILFLTSRAGGYVNGNVVLTDGGMLSLVPGSY